MSPSDIPAGTEIQTLGLPDRPAISRPSMDFETYSEAGFRIDPVSKTVKGIGSQGKGGLPAVGTPVYAEHPSTEVLCLYYDLKDGQGVRGFVPGFSPEPTDLIEHVRAGGMVEAFNFTFEWWIWNMICARRWGWPTLTFEQGVCVMARSRRFSLPGSLGKCAGVLGLEGKQYDGQTLLRKLSRPHKPTKQRDEYRWLPWTAPEDFGRLYSYCAQDVTAEDEVAARIPDMTDYERATWLTDQRINARGVLVDRQTLDNCLRLYRATEKRLTLELANITQGAVGSVSEVAKLREWLAGRGVSLPDLSAETIDATLDDQSVAGDVRRVLEIRQSLAGANIKKLFTLDRQLNSDNRLRDQYMYCGADRTGRWSAGGVQLQNLTAKGPKARQCNDCDRHFGEGAVTLDVVNACPECGSTNTSPVKDWLIDSMLWGIQDINALHDKPQLVEQTWGDPVKLVTGCLRGLFRARDGHRLICCDFSAIEAVVLACLSRCQWRIDVFSTHGKIYEMSAANITGKTLQYYLDYKEQNGTHHEDRKKIGKVAELACFTRDTQVLTARGYVRIVDVTENDLLWDGVEWVSSEGAIHKGRREIISLDGIEVTPNHPINLSGFWKEASQLVSDQNFLNRALATGSANLPSFARNVEKKKEARSYNAAVVPLSTFARCLTSMAGSLRAALSAAVKSRATRMLKSIFAMPKLCRTTSTGEGCATGYPLRSHAAITREIEGIRTTAAGVFQCAANGATTVVRFWRTFRQLKDGTTRCLKWIGSMLTGTTSRVIFASSLSKLITLTNARSNSYSRGSTNLKDVYDIVNAGPRHRFTIKTDSGHMLVHNSGYGGWVGAWKAFGATQNDDELKQLIIAWRDASPEIVEFWGGQFRQIGPKPWDAVPELFGLEGAAIAAIQNPGQCYHVGGISYGVHNDILYCRLPSGRYLHYWRPRLAPTEDRLNRGPAVKITFEGYNSNPTKGRVGWSRMETYGGRLAENCIAEGTQVLTADGWKSIENVTPDDLVHDGVEFVENGGALFKSIQPCVTVDGVFMTEDHKVMTDDGWKEAAQKPRPYRPNLRHAKSTVPGKVRRQKTLLAVCVRVWQAMCKVWYRRKERHQKRQDAELRMLNQTFYDSERVDSWHDETPGVRSMALNARPLPITFASSMAQLRRTRDSCLRALATVRKLLGRHRLDLPAGVRTGQTGQQRRVLAGQLPMGQSACELEQPQIQRPHRYPARASNGGAGVASERDRRDDAIVQDRERLARRKAVYCARRTQPRKVYDIVNCGPRRRFVVKGRDGPFIVHNCTQAVAADIQAEALVRVEQAGYPIVMHTHDEIIAECPDGFGSWQEMAAIMSQRPAWAQWWPIKADGWEHTRYQKD